VTLNVPFPQLDQIDARLVQLLRENGRASYAALAPEVGLSQAAVRSRVQRILDERVIDINGRVDPSVLGIGVFALALVKVRGPIEAAAKRVGEPREAVFITQTTGRCDLLIELRCHDHQHLFRVLDQIRSVDVVDHLESVVFLHYFKQDWSETGAVTAGHPPKVGQATGGWQRSEDGDEAPILDDTDLELLRALLADGRATYAELSQIVGLSQAAVRDRVIRLLDTVLTIQASPGPGTIDGLEWAALLVSTEAESEKVANAIVQVPELPLVASTTGQFDIVCELWANDADHMIDILDRIRSTDGIQSVEAVRYLRTLKQDFGGGVL
jgi:DNA-binding Lrp family transcriptional regulator